MAVFLANVGVNSAHAARSPLFGDGTFELLPIPERHPWRPPMLRLGDVKDKCAYAPLSWRTRAIHLDPDLDSCQATYGDNCRHAGRAFSLRRARPGDLIAFLARLQPKGQPAGFHLVGCLEIVDALEDVNRDPGHGWWDANAHVRRSRATDSWDEFWVFKGTPASRLFSRAILSLMTSKPRCLRERSVLRKRWLRAGRRHGVSGHPSSFALAPPGLKANVAM